MKINSYLMPPFIRIQWASKLIKDKYESKLESAKKVYYFMEQKSVEEGMRDATTTHISPDDLDKKQAEFLEKGLYFLPITKVPFYRGNANYHPSIRHGEPWNYYGVLARGIDKAYEFAEATKNNDHITIGKLLGFPRCCSDFFEEEWLNNGYKDPVWQQALNSPEDKMKFKSERVVLLKDVDWLSNNLLRVVQANPTFHFQHSFYCEESRQKSEEWIKCAYDNGMEEEVKNLEMFMRMPMEWDALKGIAYIRTPLFKIGYNSVSCFENYRVQIEGTYFPIDSPINAKFPWSERMNTIKRNENKLAYGGDL